MKKYVFFVLIIGSIANSNISMQQINQSAINSLIAIKRICNFAHLYPKAYWFSPSEPSRQELTDALTLEDSNNKLALQFPVIKELKNDIDGIVNENKVLNTNSLESCIDLVDKGDYSLNGKLEQALLCLRANTRNESINEKPSFDNEALEKSLLVNNIITNQSRLHQHDLADKLTVVQSKYKYPLTDQNLYFIQQTSAKIAEQQNDIDIQSFSNCLEIINKIPFSQKGLLSQTAKCLQANITNISKP